MIVRALAPAKINLGLEVLGRRDDGYHEIRTMLAAVSLFDRIQIATPGDPMIGVDTDQLEFEGNLVSAAVSRLRARHPRLDPSIFLWKRIPIAAGLGGASTDAAATLIACNLCHKLGETTEALIEEGATLGSDVPFFFTGGIALATGRGDVITPLSSPPRLFVVIVAPRVEIPSKTATLYQSLKPWDFSSGERTEERAKTGSDIWAEGALQNAFERPLYELQPSLKLLPGVMRRCGASAIGLSGAGPAHYALEPDLERARRIAEQVRADLGRWAAVHLCRLLPHGIMTTQAQ